jgi:hypothetical protein
MNPGSQAIATLIEVASEYDPRLEGPQVVRFQKLGLFVRVRPLQVQTIGAMSLFIALVEAAMHPKGTGMGVTCVGHAADPVQAEKDALAQWYLGVLPVLAHWRGAHSCFVGTATFELPASSGPATFDVIKGPVIVRGEHDAGEAGAPSTDAYLTLLAEPLRARPWKSRPHWLECFAMRMADGSCDATCRLDNLDWSPGNERLVADARTWPGSTPSYDSRRQFLLLLPQGSGSRDLPPPSLLARLLRKG